MGYVATMRYIRVRQVLAVRDTYIRVERVRHEQCTNSGIDQNASYRMDVGKSGGRVGNAQGRGAGREYRLSELTLQWWILIGYIHTHTVPSTLAVHPSSAFCLA